MHGTKNNILKEGSTKALRWIHIVQQTEEAAEEGTNLWGGDGGGTSASSSKSTAAAGSPWWSAGRGQHASDLGWLVDFVVKHTDSDLKQEDYCFGKSSYYSLQVWPMSK
jgi:hypothetical protein